jgi:hypothetical protein
MAAPTGPGRHGADGIDQVVSAMQELCAEVKDLSRRVDRLSATVKKLEGGSTASPAKGSKSGDRSTAPRRERRRIAVVVRPLPELAMAAMAETSLRDLPGVREVIASERVEDWARFTLEADADTDVIAEMKVAMPVAFTVVDPGPEEISIELHWAWGTSD